MSATSAPPSAINYSVHSSRSHNQQQQQYHGLGTMSLNYKISDVTSTDPAYSAHSINTDHQFGSSNGRGWVSRKFCDFPQSITIRFENAVRLKTLQFLSHEMMISARVELHYMPLDAVSISERRRIGHFEFQNQLPSQESTLQPVRELKTVHFGATTRQLTLDFYGPFQHKDNIFHQIGLVSLRAIGEIIGSVGDQAGQNLPQAVIASNDNQNDSKISLTPIRDYMQKRMDEQDSVSMQYPNRFRTILFQIHNNITSYQQQIDLTHEKLHHHQHQVDGESKENDPNSVNIAKQKLLKFKLAEEVLTKHGNRFLQLQGLKQQAIQNEDYMTAKKIKGLISQIEEQISRIDGQTGEIPDEINPKVLILKHMRQYGPQSYQKSAEQIYKHNLQLDDTSAQNLMNEMNKLYEDRRILADSQMQRHQNNSMNIEPMHRGNQSELIEEGLLELSLQGTINNQIEQPQFQDPEASRTLAATIQQTKHSEDAVVPAHRMGVKMTFEEQMALYDNQIKQGLDPSPNMNLQEEIKDAQIEFGINEYSGPLSNLFDVNLIKLLTSLKWQDRFQGLKDITSSLSQYAGEVKFVETMNHLLDLYFDEKNTQICLQTIILINIILTSLPEFTFEHTDRAISFICDKGVESKIQLASNTSYELFCRHKAADLHDTIGLLATQQSFFNKVTLNSHKQILFRQNLIHRATLDFDSICNERISDTVRPEYPLWEVLEMLKQSLQHPDREIRSISQLILQQVYEKNGFSVIEQITLQLHPQILQAIKPKIPEVEKVILFLQKSKRANNNSVYGASGANSWPITLKNRMNKAGAIGSGSGPNSQRQQQSFVKRKLPIKSQSQVSLQEQQNQERSPKEIQHQNGVNIPNNDLANLINPSGVINDLDTTTTQATTEKAEDESIECQFCGISSPEFAHADKMDLHYVLQCLMLTNCAGCTQIIEVGVYNDHKLTQCAKKADFKQCPRCQMAIEADFFEQHITRLECVPFESEVVRCPLCQRDLPILESEEKTWKDHLAIEKCSGANVRISTNAKARVSILRAKQPPASEVIMEEDDEEDDNDTVGQKTPKRAGAGRNTEMSIKFEQEQDANEIKDSPDGGTSQKLRMSIDEEQVDEQIGVQAAQTFTLPQD